MISVIRRGLLLCLLLVLPTGCARMIQGDWRSIEPTGISPDVPRIRQITFDGSDHFHAKLLYHHRVISADGTYELTADRLLLRPEGEAGLGTYECTIRHAGVVLVVTQNGRTYRLCRDADGESEADTIPQLLDLPASRPDVSSTQTAPASRVAR